MHPTPSEMANAVIEVLQSVAMRVKPQQASEWKRQIAAGVGDLGDANDWEVCSEVKELFEPEWLYDLVWWRNDSTGHLSEVYLVLESERDGRERPIMVDFEKLLVAKSTLKVMIFQGYNHSIPELLRKQEAGIKAFQRHDADEIFILAAFNNDLSRFEFRQVTGG